MKMGINIKVNNIDNNNKYYNIYFFTHSPKQIKIRNILFCINLNKFFYLFDSFF
jgi:hypothetical protein